MESRAKYTDREFDKRNSPVEHPEHYNMGKYECIDVIEDWGLGFNLGNALKYICRAGYKGSIEVDLEKAKFYIERELSKLTDDPHQSCDYNGAT